MPLEPLVAILANQMDELGSMSARRILRHWKNPILVLAKYKQNRISRITWNGALR